MRCRQSWESDAPRSSCRARCTTKCWKASSWCLCRRAPPEIPSATRESTAQRTGGLQLRCGACNPSGQEEPRSWSGGHVEHGRHGHARPRDRGLSGRLRAPRSAGRAAHPVTASVPTNANRAHSLNRPFGTVPHPRAGCFLQCRRYLGLASAKTLASAMAEVASRHAQLRDMSSFRSSTAYH